MKFIRLYAVIATASISLIGCTKSADKKEMANEVSTKPQTPAWLNPSRLEYRGDSISLDSTVSLDVAFTKLKSSGQAEGKFYGQVVASCPNKGCWVTVKDTSGAEISVSFKDYGFFVPIKDLTGKHIVIAGIAKNDTISVATQVEDAKKEGLNKDLIAKITKPQITPSFEAYGLALEK